MLYRILAAAASLMLVASAAPPNEVSVGLGEAVQVQVAAGSIAVTKRSAGELLPFEQAAAAVIWSGGTYTARHMT
jgi:hypothetical protein